MAKTLKRSELVDLIVRGMRIGSSGDNDIINANRILESYLNKTPTNVPLWVQDVEMLLIKGGNKLRAVKTIKDNTGWDLRTCKDAAEYFEKYRSWNVTMTC